MMPQREADGRSRHGGNRIRAAVMPATGGRPWGAVALTAGVVAVLLGGVTTGVGDAVLGSAPASLPGAGPARGVESEDGRLRSRMILSQGTNGTHLVFEVHLRDRTWMAPDGRLLRIVVRGKPEYGLHEPFEVARGATRSGEHEHPDRAPAGNPKPPAPSTPVASPVKNSPTYRSAIVAAATLPGAATGFTYFTAALDVTGLKRGDYVASVELLTGRMSRAAAPGAGSVIDRVVHPYSAW